MILCQFGHIFLHRFGLKMTKYHTLRHIITYYHMLSHDYHILSHYYHMLSHNIAYYHISSHIISCYPMLFITHSPKLCKQLCPKWHSITRYHILLHITACCHMIITYYRIITCYRILSHIITSHRI